MREAVLPQNNASLAPWPCPYRPLYISKAESLQDDCCFGIKDLSVTFTPLSFGKAIFQVQSIGPEESGNCGGFISPVVIACSRILLFSSRLLCVEQARPEKCEKMKIN